MKKIRGLLLLPAVIFAATSFAQQIPGSQPDQWLSNACNTIHTQLSGAAEAYRPGASPRSVKPDGTVRLTNLNDWTTGFFSGTLWYGYEITGDPRLAGEAEKFTLALDSLQYLKNTHDVGFMIYCSYGNAYRITGNKGYLPVLTSGAQHLLARFSPVTGVVRSWDFGDWKYPVIIDNMMNLEYLYWAAGALQSPSYAAAATSHALTTMKNHFRKNYSSYHVVDYDPATGQVLQKMTHQGLTNESSWARGQAWGLYGYTMCYRDTRDPRFLEQAQKIAAYIMAHPSMPKDKIPAWDLDVHNALDKEFPAARDASAAAVIASALLELGTFAKDGKPYLDYAEDILKSLSSDTYLARPGENHFFLLKHSVGAFLYNSEIDTPLNYADYYYLEALKRYINIMKIHLQVKN